MPANPIAATWWRLYRRGGLVPLLALTGTGAVAAVIGGVWAQLNDRPPNDVVSALLVCQMLLLLGVAPVIAVSTLRRAALDGTLTSDRNSPLRPRQLLLGYLAGPVAAGLVAAAPGLVATGALAGMFADDAHTGWFLGQALAASTGAMLATVVTVALLTAPRHRSALAWCAVVLLYLLMLSFESGTSVGFLVWLLGMLEIALQSTALRFTAAEILGLTWPGQLVVVSCALAAGTRTLDPRADHRARRAPWIVVVLYLWCVQAVALAAFDLNVDGYNHLAPEMLPLAVLLLWSARADDTAWVDAMRRGRLALPVSIVPTALAMSACFAAGIWLTPHTNGSLSNPASMAFCSACVLVTLSFVADTASIMSRPARRWLGVVVALAMVVPLVLAGVTYVDDVECLSLLGAFATGSNTMSFRVDRFSVQSMVAWVLGSAVLRQVVLERARSVLQSEQRRAGARA